MKAAILGAVLTLCAGAAAAYEPDQRGDMGAYASARLGAVFADADEIPDIFEMDAGLTALGALGYGFGALKVEGEVGWRRVEAGPVIDERDDIFTFFANAVVEFPQGFVRPYVGAGAGLALVHVKSDFFFIDESQTSFAYQIIGGLAIPLTDRLDLVTDYRYTATEGLEIGPGPESETHNVTGGVRINF